MSRPRFHHLAVMICLLSVGVLSHARGADTGVGKNEWAARGVVEPRVQATLSSQLSERIAEIPVDLGSRFRKGDLLVGFECAVERARLKAAEAELEGISAKLSSLQRLDKVRSVGRVEVDIAQAEQKRLAAVVEERRTAVGHCTVLAPFDGLVVDLPVHANESADYGKPLVSILDDRSLRLVLLAPSGWAAWLTRGLAFTFTVDETGEPLPARVTHLGARIDATSQTISVFADVDRSKAPVGGGVVPPLVAGMTGTATFPPPDHPGPKR